MRTAERIAKTLISIGGLATILAVIAICVFLVATVVPLFRGTTVEAGAARATVTEPEVRVRDSAIDEQRRLSWSLLSNGTLELYRLDTGERFETFTPFAEGAAGLPTCAAREPDESGALFGFADGTVRPATISFATHYLRDENASDAQRALTPGAMLTVPGGIVERTNEGQLRVQTLDFALLEPIFVGGELLCIDRAERPDGALLCVLTKDAKLRLIALRETVDMLSDEVTREVTTHEVAYESALVGVAPFAVRLLGAGDNVLAIWHDGTCLRFDARDLDLVQPVERIDLVSEAGAEVSCLASLTGKRTLIVGDSLGRVRGWFRTKTDDAGTADGARLRLGHEFEAGGAPVTTIAPSAGSRVFAVGDTRGAVRLLHMTSEKQLASLSVGDAPITSLALAPRENALVVRTSDSIACFDVASEHAEISATSLFRPVWYENYPAPAHVWQSSSGTDDFEAKLGLMPLIFGTLKATLYSMLFGVPLALLAAIFSSEYLEPRVRVWVKSTIEVMAGLPSVVLGFLAAIVIAPFVQESLALVLTALYSVPLALLVGAHAWQLVPQRIALRLGGVQRFALIGTALPFGLLAAWLCAPLVESVLFAGDVQAWLDGRVGGALGGWVFLLLPLSAAAVTLLSGRLLDPVLRRTSVAWTRTKCARFDVFRFGAAAALTLGIALLAGALLSSAGVDPRGALVDTYVQRNALVVGFIMGFAIIPIIYTLAEDALTSVPEHLRLASLGAGATQWQTAMRVIVPTAMSGLFSAVMVGLGRAVGETMIVLMAAGNTPVMQWNVFNGFRTLSANIAVELPEAVNGSTHYRTLFLAALSLFAITFAVNTVAEVVRQRFRKRAFQL